MCVSVYYYLANRIVDRAATESLKLLNIDQLYQVFERVLGVKEDSFHSMIYFQVCRSNKNVKYLLFLPAACFYLCGPDWMAQKIYKITDLEIVSKIAWI